MKRTDIIISKIISYLFHPLLMPTYAMVIIFNSNTHYAYMPASAQRLIYLLIFFTTFLLPVSVIPFLMNLKLISGIGMENSRERIIPLVITIISYSFSYYILGRIPVSTIGLIKTLVLGSLVLIVLNLLITIKWKISAHLIGMGGLLAFLFFYSIFLIANLSMLIIFICMLSGLVGFARLNLQVHNPSQVYAGFIAGFIGMWLTFYLSIV